MTRDVRSIHLTIKKKTVKCVVPPPSPLSHRTSKETKFRCFISGYRSVGRGTEEPIHLKIFWLWSFSFKKKKLNLEKKKREKCCLGRRPIMSSQVIDTVLKNMNSSSSPSGRKILFSLYREKPKWFFNVSLLFLSFDNYYTHKNIIDQCPGDSVCRCRRQMMWEYHSTEISIST